MLVKIQQIMARFANFVKKIQKYFTKKFRLENGSPVFDYGIYGFKNGAKDCIV